MSSATGPSNLLGEFIAECAQLSLDSPIDERARAALLDAIGLGLAGRSEQTVQAYHSLAQPIVNLRAGCRLWGDSTVVAVLDGVTGNAMATHARFQDDCDMTSWAHPGSLITPVAVGFGEALDTDLALVLRGLLCGYATLQWLGADEVVGRAVVERGFRASPTLGSIAAAATAGVLLRLDAAQARNAIAIAADITGGVLEPVRTGAADWRVQNATAAYRGALAALLAARGVDGPAQALEGATGFLPSFAGLTDIPPRWRQPPDPAAISTVWAKPYPTLGDNMAVVATVLAVRDELAPGEQVQAVTVHQNAHFASYPGTSFRGPFSRPAQAMASTAFATAATLLYGPLRYRIYRDGLADPQVAALIERIRVVPEPSYSYLDAMVELELAGGRHLRRSAAELPRTLFFRDRASATDAFTGLLREAGFPDGFAAELPDAIFAPRATSTARRIVDIIDNAADQAD